MSATVDKHLRCRAGRPNLTLVPPRKTNLEFIVEESERDFAEIHSLLHGVRSELKFAIFLAFLNVVGVYAVVARVYGFF